MALSDDAASLIINSENVRWNKGAPLGTPVAVTFSFATGQAAYDPVPRTGFAAFTPAQEISARAALEQWSAVSGLDFVEVPDDMPGSIRFGVVDQRSSVGFGFVPGDKIGGDVFFNSRIFGGKDTSFERYPAVLLHEIGHALGFKHPSEGAPTIEAAHNNRAFTVLSYEGDISVDGLGPVDVEAVSYLYGTAGLETRFDPTTKILTRVGTALSEWVLGTELADRLLGSDGDDTLVGQRGNDFIDGGAGVDLAIYASAKDRYRLAEAEGRLLVEGPDGADVLEGVEMLRFGGQEISVADLREAGAFSPLTYAVREGSTNIGPTRLASLYSGPVEALRFQYLGSAQAESVTGTVSNDFINAMDGDDAIDAVAGDDVLDGAGGSNFLTGGTGRDIFFVDGRGGVPTWSTITDWEAGEQLSLWGWRPGVSQAIWMDVDGVAGFRGVTLHGDMDGDGAIETSVTWAGIAATALKAPVEISELLWFV